MKVRTMLQGAGVAALVLYPIYSPLLSQASWYRMHTPAPLTSIALALVLNLLGLAIIFAAIGSWLRRGSEKKHLIRVCVPAALLASAAEAVYLHSRAIPSLDLWALIVVIVTLLCIGLQRFSPRNERILLRSSYATLLGLGFFSLVVLAQLVAFACWRPSSNIAQQIPYTHSSGGHGRRIVWILFDELSYNQLFLHRYPGLQLPNFDAMRATSTLFADVKPGHPSTELAVPSILLGHEIDRVDYTYHNRLMVGQSKRGLRPFNASETPFAVARSQGLSTGVAGWFNPYCTMLRPYLNECYWTFEQDLALDFVDKHSFRVDLAAPWDYWIRLFRQHLESHRLASRVLAKLAPGDARHIYPAQRIRVYEDLLTRASRMLEQPQPDFVYLHLPLPHPPNIYNRSARRLDTSGNNSYADSLALADETLGHLVAILEQSPQWKDTAVVVCSDHAWRTYLWKSGGAFQWTEEDRAAAHGLYDPRPVLMVHQPGQTQPATIDTPFPLFRVHDILDGLIARKPMSY